jgi:Arc/MetJ-type ribon-helix-helix transcriptional regulator
MKKISTSDFKLITLFLPRKYLSDLEILVQKGNYPSRAESIRMAVRDLLYSELWSVKK